MNLKDLIEKRAKVWETAKNFVDTHENENGVLSAENTATYNRMEQEIEDLTNAIDRQQRAERREAEFSKPVNSPLTGKPYVGEKGEEKTGRASDAYKGAMLSAMRSNFRNVSNVLQEGVDSDGGYLVPVEYDRRLIDVLEEENIMRRLGTKIVTSIRLTSRLPSLLLHGLKRAVHLPLVMQPLTRFIWMRTNCMWQSRLRKSCCMTVRSILKTILSLCLVRL